VLLYAKSLHSHYEEKSDTQNITVIHPGCNSKAISNTSLVKLASITNVTGIRERIMITGEHL